MKAITIDGPSRFTLQRNEVEQPAAPGRGRILVRMQAGSLNFADLAVAGGQYPGAVYPNVALCDGAGEVIALGDDVWQVRLGDRVALHVKPRWIAGRASAERAQAMRGATVPGALAEIVDVDANAVVVAPAHLGWEEIGILPICAMTAWRALEAANVGPGSTVVTLGTGGVSVFVVQLAKARGARVLVTSSSDDKLARARALGADGAINYRERASWDDDVLAATDGNGADLVIDPVGGDDFGRSLAAVRHGGTIALVGFLGGAARADLLPAIFKEIRIQGSNGGSVADLRGAVTAIAAHRIHPVVDEVFGLANLTSAYERMRAGRHFGKLAVRFDW